MRSYSRVHLGALESAQVSLVAQPGATLMSLVADALGGRRQGLPPIYRELVRDASPPGAVELLRPLFGPQSSLVPDCLTPTVSLWQTDPDLLLDELAEVSPDTLLEELHRDFGGTVPGQWRPLVDQPQQFITAYARLLRSVWHAFAPVWATARPLFGREAERIGAAVVSGGVGALLAGVSPRSRYADSTLYLPDPHPATFERDGRRIVLVPLISGGAASIFSLDRPDLIWIGYPLPGLGLLWDNRSTPEPPTDRLTLLLGRLRATTLRVATGWITMSDLASLLHCTAATATYHCDLLEAAGLLQRERRGRQVRIRQTPRGQALVDVMS